MFHKPFRVQSNVPCKGVERKTLKSKIAVALPLLSPQQLEDLLPQGIPLFIIKLVTFGGVVVTTYHTEGDPLFFDHGSSVCPSIYSAWRYPAMLRPVMIANQTLSKLQYGADLLLPHVLKVEEGGYSLEGFEKGEYCSLQVKGTEMLVGVGMCLTPYEKMVEYDFRVVGFRMLHFQGDLLWEMGSTNTPMDSHMRTCIKAAARATTSGVIPIHANSAEEFEADGFGSQHILVKDPLDEEIDPDASFEEFKQATIAALTPNQSMPVEDKRAAITRALEERTRYIRTLPNPKVRNLDGKKHVKEGAGPFDGLSKNPKVSLYQEAHRILDDADDEIDEVGVTLPEKYQSDVSESVHKASQYYDRLGLVRIMFAKKEGCESDSDDMIELDEEEFRQWLQNSDDSSASDADEIGISLPKEYAAALKGKSSGTAAGKHDSPASSGKNLGMAPVNEVYELREELQRLVTMKREFLPPEQAQPRKGWNKEADFRKLTRKYKPPKPSEDVATKEPKGKESPKMESAGLQSFEDIDEIGISMPEEYQLTNVEGAGLGAEGGSDGGAHSRGTRLGTAKTWYSIPEGQGREVTPTEDFVDMDDLMKECFLASVKALKDKSEDFPLPLLTSTFYRVHMLELCPPHLKLDVKKSTFKKLSKFLQTMQEEGIIQLGENDKGSEVISTINFKHPLVKGYTPCLLGNADSAVGSDSPGVSKPSLKISTLYMPSHRLVSFFRQLGFTKASILDYQQVRESVLRYVKENKLVDTANPKHVLPDPTLGDALHHRGAEYNKGILRQELINMVIEEMKPAYSITRGSSAPIIKRGKLEPVQLSLVQKMGNKKVTLVDNLEYYGVPAADVAQSLQKMAAASTTVNDVQGKPTARQVQVQGNAVKVIAKLLQDSYGIPMNYIEAIDKIKPPKTQKKRKKK